MPVKLVGANKYVEYSLRHCGAAKLRFTFEPVKRQAGDYVPQADGEYSAWSRIPTKRFEEGCGLRLLMPCPVAFWHFWTRRRFKGVKPRKDCQKCYR
jgi:hypothetical protein